MAAADAPTRPSFPVTKIRRPLLRGGLVDRSRLEDDIAQALTHGGVTLLCAPAGWGKTVALARAVARLPAGAALAWVSLDEDDDVPRLLGCLLAALDPFDLPWRIDPDALAAMAMQPAHLRRVADELLNALAAADVPHGVLVLDDLHRVREAPAFELLDMLAQQLPPPWTLALATRVDPPLALARLRVRGELSEFRQPVLAFVPAEIQALRDLLGQPGVAAPAGDELLARTEGWPAGLRLCLSTGRAGSAPGGEAQRLVFAYLAEEIFATLPAELREFLLQVSVLHELRASRCAAVAQDPRALQRLEDIERRGLFASVLDVGDELTLKLHDLFRDFLQDRLRREQPEAWCELLRRAAAGETDPLRRIAYMLQAGDWDAAERQLVDATPGLLPQGGGAQALRLAEQFPPERQATSPRLALVRGLVAFPGFAWRTMQEAMQCAVDGFERAGEAGPLAQARAFNALALTATGRVDDGRAELEAIGPLPPVLALQAQVQVGRYWSTGALGPADGPASCVRHLVDILANGAPPSLWFSCAPHFMLIGRAGMNAALAQYVSMARAVAGDGHAPLRAVANILDAWLLMWRGELDAAEARFAEVDGDNRWLGEPRNLRIPILAFRAVRHALRGDVEPFRALGVEVLADVDGDPQRRGTWRGVYLYMQARMAAGLEDWDTAGCMYGELLRTPAAQEWPYLAHARAAVGAQFALRDGRLDAALQALRPAAAVAHEIDSFGLHATACLLLAQAELSAGDAPAAARALAPLLGAQGRDELGGVLLTGASVLRALVGADWRGALDGRGLAVLQRWLALSEGLRGARPAAEREAPAPAVRGLAVHPLSERELEVLQRIAEGDSNKLIARQLDLSPHTVKRHVANILDKLALASRGQAAAWYRANEARL
ncbi:LuxR C-terminal-related transcriptional regulator [Roseateles cellulosilyticus]|uniref:LuxR C-terminal-related transcriptional regulator n=1 Tax=Pelomonas cellulosilytica TaxID=2906762 RepID=A0ABS8XUR9_9BURK|nr:LuxR C-terminal-related transcriptional regulator [Pelomonas sp. P8]MCE4555638.1 LuxR C-terminal-related transcriptional regulator [Pelomonas sp. P8]